MEIRSVQRDGAEVRYFRFGDPKGQPFVIISGVTVKSVMFSAAPIAAMYKAIAADHDVYVIDRRSSINGEYNIFTMAEDTAAVLDELSLKGCDIYGVSQGGMISLVLAMKRPDLVRRLMLCSTAAFIPEDAAKVFSEWAELAAKRASDELMLSFARLVYSDAYCDKFREAYIEFGKTVTEEEYDWFRSCVRGMEGVDLSSGLGSISCPVLVLAGGRDRLFGIEPSERIAKAVNGELRIYPDGDHAVYDEEPDVLIRIKEFSDRV